MNKKTVFSFFSLALCVLLFFSTSCTKDKTAELTPSQILSSTKWKTTVVKNAAGADVTATNPNYIGIAAFNMDGSFIITDFAGGFRSSGTWAITADGKKRILVAATFTRIVDIITLNSESFTYEIMNADSTKVQVFHEPLK